MTTQCFYDVEVKGEAVGKIVLGLFGDDVRKTAKSLVLCA